MKVEVADALISSGKKTPEVRILEEDKEVLHESSPAGSTVGLKEKDRQKENPSIREIKEHFEQGQAELDQWIEENLGTKLGTPLSLAKIRYEAHKRDQALHKFITQKYSARDNIPSIISNLLNAGPHAADPENFCEFMVIPTANNLKEHVFAAQQVYQDLRKIVVDKYGSQAGLIGREGGVAPCIGDPLNTIEVLNKAIEQRNRDRCKIAIDVAANSFTHEKQPFIYKLGEKSLSSGELLDFYGELVDKYPSIDYLEDPFHEQDMDGWKNLRQRINNTQVVADDLTVTTKDYLKKYSDLYDAAILKPNQVGSFTGLVEAFKTCQELDKNIIVSQRSGETDTSTITDIGIGLGSDYLKIGAPARERILKYNNLLRRYRNGL